jgi:hypothetical protein
MQRIRRHAGDTAVVETAAARSAPTKTGAVPSFNNALAISELFTRRARTSEASLIFVLRSAAA